MDLSHGGEFALAAYVFPLVLAGLTDFLSLRIPNWVTVALAASFPVVALLFGHDVDWLSHAGAGFAMFVGAALLFAFRVIGGGDAKLLAAVALWTGFAQILPFLALTALVGGVFALLIILLRSPLVQVGLFSVLRRMPFAPEKAPIPYGVPIAVAGILMAPSLPFLT